MPVLAPYPYAPLPPQCIRVLDLHPGSADAPLECEFVTQKVDGKPYEALSYVWGDPVSLSPISLLFILLSGLLGTSLSLSCTLNTTPAIISNFSPYCTTLISRKTPLAFVRCTDHQKNSGYLGVGAFLSKALAAFRLPSETRRIWVDALCINQKDVSERQSQVRLMGAVYGKAEHVLCWLGPFPDNPDAETKARHTINFLRRFNEKPKEYVKAAHQHLHFGEDVANTSDDVVLLDSWLGIKQLFDIEYFHRAWIIQEVGLAQHARFYWGSQSTYLDWDEIAAFCNFMDANGASIINHLGLKSWVANHINLVWANDESGKPVHNFVEVLHWARVHRSTDPRDYIYALLSHASASVDGKLIVQPNYRISTEEAYTELAVNVIQRTKSLHILAFVDHHEEAGILVLPSWVPDWHALNLVAPLRCPTKAASETDSSFSIVGSENGMILKCRGFIIDTIRATSDMIEPSGLTVTTLDNERKKNIPFLIDHIWHKTVVEPGIPLGSPKEFLAALSLTLTGGYRNDLDSTSGERQKEQQGDLAALILEYERIRPQGQSDGFLASLSSEDKAFVRKVANTGSAHQFVQDMTWTSMCRRAFRTAERRLGLGPRIMRKGDICTVLFGAVYPMILRRSDGHFKLIGPALMYGFMNGEAAKSWQGGEFLEQEFAVL
jgi:Heterokaryon incompatibility protein (HET)